MSMKRLTKVAALLATLAMVLAACGGSSADAVADANSSDHSETEEAAGHDEVDSHEVEYTFGAPGDASAATRVIEVDANDDFTFGPSAINVSMGETVTFIVTNTGSLPHDFTLGDQATQDGHEDEMAAMAASGEMGEHADPNAVVVEAGETKELTWTFSHTGTVLIGCHQPGHYAAEMTGLIEVAA